MKHLFFIHSHITYLVVNQYVIDKSIDIEDCMLVLCSRYSRLPDCSREYHTIMTPNELLPEGETRVVFNNGKFTGYRNLKYIEDKINEYFNGNQFCLYLPNTGSDIHNAIVTMKQCVGYYLIEEGGASYFSREEIPLIFHGVKQQAMLLLSKCLPRFFALKSACFAFNNDYYIGAISTSPKAFYDRPGEHIIITPPFQRVHIDIVPDVILSVDQSILLTIGKKFPEKLYRSISTFFKQSHFGRIAVKFHPAYYSDLSLLISFRKGLKSIFGEDMIELDQTCILENMLFSYPIAFCSDFSSVGIYAANFNRLCFSYYNLFPKLYPESGYKEKFGNNWLKILCESYALIPDSILDILTECGSEIS